MTRIQDEDKSPVLVADRLGVTFPGPVRAVVDVSFKINHADALIIIGESGSGKTALVRTIAGVMPSQFKATISGTIHFKGNELPVDRKMAPTPGISLVPQDAMAALNPTMKLGRQINLVIAARQRRDPPGAVVTASEVLAMVDLPDRALASLPHELSGGQRQRGLLAMALAAAPDLLIADEPTTALDTIVSRQIISLLIRFRTEMQQALILVTHDMSVAEDIALTGGQIAVMHSGRLVEYGPARDILESPVHAYTRALRDARPALHENRTRLASIVSSQYLRHGQLQSLPGRPGHWVEV